MVLGAILLALWMAEGVLALGMYQLANPLPETMDAWCPNALPSRYTFLKEMRTIVTGTDVDILELSSTYMCSSVCPCPTEYTDERTGQVFNSEEFKAPYSWEIEAVAEGEAEAGGEAETEAEAEGEAEGGAEGEAEEADIEEAEEEEP
jgi:hypothetical protein